MKKTMLFVLLEQYADWEGAYLAPGILSLGKGKFSIKTVSLTKEPVHSIGGFSTLPDYDIESAPKNFDSLVLIGGNSWRNESAVKVMSLVNTAIKNHAVLAGICDASAFLGKNGILNDIEHTSNDLNDLKQWAGEAYTGEAKYIKQQVVRSGNIITANGTAALEFSREVMLALEVASENEILGIYNFHKLGFYNSEMPEFIS